VVPRQAAHHLLAGVEAQLAEFADGGAIDLRRAGGVRRAVRLLCATVRPDAVALCDGFDLDDFTLNSCIGRHDGEAYKALFAAAQRNPLNTEPRARCVRDSARRPARRWCGGGGVPCS